MGLTCRAHTHTCMHACMHTHAHTLANPQKSCIFIGMQFHVDFKGGELWAACTVCKACIRNPVEACARTLFSNISSLFLSHVTPERHQGDIGETGRTHQHLHFADVLRSACSFLHIQSSPNAATAASRIRGGRTAFTLQRKEEEVLLRD